MSYAEFIVIFIAVAASGALPSWAWWRAVDRETIDLLPSPGLLAAINAPVQRTASARG